MQVIISQMFLKEKMDEVTYVQEFIENYDPKDSEFEAYMSLS